MPTRRHSYKGVVDLPSLIVPPIIELRLKFAEEKADFGHSPVTAVLNMTRSVVGVVIEAVRDVVELPRVRRRSELHSRDRTITQGDQQRMLILVDIEHLMTGAEMGLVAEIG